MVMHSLFSVIINDTETAWRSIERMNEKAPINEGGNEMKKYLLFLITALILLFGLQTVTYAGEPYIPEKMIVVMTPNLVSHNINLGGVAKTSDVTKLKSSNKSVVKLSKFVYEGTVYVSVKPNKPGKATVTFDYKYKGKTCHAKVKVKVYKYFNAIKSLKIGSKNYASKFKKDNYAYLKKKLTGKLKIKAKAGYKILDIYSYNRKDGSNFKTLKNGKKVTIKKGYALCIDLEKTSNKDVFSFTLAID